MTKHHMTQTTLGRTAPRAPEAFLDRLFELLQAIVHEWRTRRSIERSLGQLSSFYLRDVGLTKADVEAACPDSFDLSASRALSSATLNRTANW